MTRSRKFVWFVGGMETLQNTGERALNDICRFLSRHSSTYKRFDDQSQWKRNKLSYVLFTERAIA